MIHVVEDDAGVRELELYTLRTAGYEAVSYTHLTLPTNDSV